MIALFVVSNLKKSYKSTKDSEKTVLKDFNINLEDKGMLFIIGKSGSGKTTLLNLIGGLDKYDDGEIIINKKSLNTFTEKDFDNYRASKIGFIFQEHNLLEKFTVEENIKIAKDIQGKIADKEEVSNVLSLVDLEGYEKRYPRELSTGQSKE